MKLHAIVIAISIFLPTAPGIAADDVPRAVDERLEIQLFAESPQLVTPTGIDVDHVGRVWAIESNTHFRPDDYEGHESDRILVMQDTDGDDRADEVTMFVDGLTHTMSVAVRPVWLPARATPEELDAEAAAAGRSPNASLAVYVATRRDIHVFYDDDGDLRADRKRRIMQLDTQGTYPHNGLAGFAWDAGGWLYFGFGENLGADYRLIGSDGTALAGGGEGGNMYLCRPDGSQLRHWATGFWNPHASCVDAWGRLFTVDNDPDSLPPCRLLHVVAGGDFGYRFRNGRKGMHPFTAWNGEVPGTLPMIAGTGEAPSGVVAYESDLLPDEYRGQLLATSWGDHRIDLFRLQPNGSSFVSLPQTVIQGGSEFRPVGLALAPDGSLYCTDWVLRDYQLHGQGRVWRIARRDAPPRDPLNPALLLPSLPVEQLHVQLASPRVDIRRAAAGALQQTEAGRALLTRVLADETLADRPRLESLWALTAVATSTPRDATWPPLPAGHSDVAAAWLRQLTSPPLLRDVPEVLGDTFSFPAARQTMQPGEWRFHRAAIAAWPADAAIPRRILALFQADAAHDLFLDSALITRLAHPSVRLPQIQRWYAGLATERVIAQSPVAAGRGRTALLLAARAKDPAATPLLRLALNDEDAEVRRTAVQWVAEQNLAEFRPQLDATLADPHTNARLFLATLAALDRLDGGDPREFDKAPGARHVLPLLRDEQLAPSIRRRALRLADPQDSQLDVELLGQLLQVDDTELQREVLRTLAAAPRPAALAMLQRIVEDVEAPVELRADAAAALAAYLQGDAANAARQTLLELLRDDDARLRLEAVRSLRPLLAGDAELRVAVERAGRVEDDLARAVAEQLRVAAGQLDAPELERLLENADAGDVDAGRRLFFHPAGPGCYKCHTVDGRGGQVGPDLTRIGRTMSRRKLAESILEPSREIAPQFTTWSFLMDSGQVHSGMLVGDTRDNVQRIGTAEGRVIALTADQIEQRVPQTVSVMPADLAKQMTVDELLDVLAFLEAGN